MPKNVVMVVADDTPPEVLDYMPYLTSDPHGSWVRFSRAFLNAPVCAPSRATIFTGLNAQQSGVRNNDDATDQFHFGWDERKVLGATLQRSGYYTTLIGKYENGYPWFDVTGSHTWVPHGWDRWHGFRSNNGSGNYGDFKLVEWSDATSQYTLNDYFGANVYVTDKLNELAVDTVTNAPEPFFTYVAHYAPHDPAVPAARHESLYTDLTSEDLRRPSFNQADVSDMPQWVQDTPQFDSTRADAIDEEKRDALRCCKAIDEGIEDIIAALDARGILDDTVIWFLGDNSNLFGEHRLEDKPWAYEECIQSHWMIRWPGATTRTEGGLCSNIDIFPTLCDISGGRPMQPPSGMSIVPLLDQVIASASFREHLLIERQPIQKTFYGVRTYDDRKYVEYDDGYYERWDLSTDPYELDNLHPTQGAGGLDRVLSILKNELGAS